MLLTLDPSEAERVSANFQEFRERLVTTLRDTKDPRRLFIVLFQELKKTVLESDPEKRLPEPVIVEIKAAGLVVAQDVFNQYCADDIDFRTANEETVSQWTMDVIKMTSENFIAEDKGDPVDWEVFELDDEMRADLKANGVRWPSKRLGISRDAYALKGGGSRYVLKRLVARRFPKEFDRRLLDAELPFADFDAVVGAEVDEETKWKVARSCRVDVDGIERRKDFRLNHAAGIFDGFDRYFPTRDSDMNQALLTQDRLYYTAAAFQACLNGTIRSNARNRTLYGTDKFYCNGLEYLTPRASHRILKSVAEGKAFRTYLRRYNFDLHLLIFWLVPLRKWVKRADLGLLAAKLFYLAKQMGQNAFTPQPNGLIKSPFVARTPKEFFEYLLGLYPKFDFDNDRRHADIAAWFVEKLIIVIYKHLREKFGLYPLDWPFKSTDTTEVEISLDGFVLCDDEIREVEEFLRAYAARTKVEKRRQRRREARAAKK